MLNKISGSLNCSGDENLESVRGRRAQRILLVEDDDDLRSTLAHFLESHGYPVFQAPSALQAVLEFQAERGQFFAVVTDFEMPPGDTGFQLIRRLDSLSSSVQLFVLMSGSLEARVSLKETLEANLRSPLFYMSKPFDGQELLILLRG